MTGWTEHTRECLNDTLLFIIKLLNENKVDNWFISYGTLLGIVRDNQCIDGDDDVDIVIDKKNYEIVKKILQEHNIKIEDATAITAFYPEGICLLDTKEILKTKPCEKYCSVDFYMSNLDDNGNFHDTWENVIWSNCYNNKNELIEYAFRGEKLYLPNNYETKLSNRYGEDWRIPLNKKFSLPRKQKI